MASGSSGQFRGSPVALLLSRDNTPGCTRQACAFRDLGDELAGYGAVVLGISTDSVDSHARFRDKHQLNFPLLADAENRVCQRYGAWREKNMYGKKSLGIQRSTYLIDAAGKICRVWKRVRVEGHDQQVLAALRELIKA